MSKYLKKEKILPILLAIWPYLIGLFVLFEYDTDVTILLYLYYAATAVIYIGNIINAFKYQSENEIKELSFYNMLIKLVHIPFYLMVFVIGAMFSVAIAVPALTFVTPILLTVFFITDAILMFTSSMYGVNAIRKAYRAGVITRKSAIKNVIMQFVFVLDVISAVRIYCEVRRRKGDRTILV